MSKLTLESIHKIIDKDVIRQYKKRTIKKSLTEADHIALARAQQKRERKQNNRLNLK